MSALFSLIFQWPGVVLSADGWAYWEGAVSLMSGEGYRYLGGQPIVAWPPGFSAYLALWQLVFGASAGTLAFAHAAAIGIAAGLWIAVAIRLLPRRELSWPTLAVAVTLAFVMPISLRLILSESLFMVWMGWALLVAIGRPCDDEGHSSRVVGESLRGVLFALAVAALLLTRHVGAAYLPALLWLYWSSEPMATIRARAWALLAAAVALGAWFAARVWLGLLDNNPRATVDTTLASRLAESLGANFSALWSSLLPAWPVGVAAAAISIGAIFLLLGVRGRRSGQPEKAGKEVGVGGLTVATALASGCAAVAWALHGVSGRRIVLPVAALLVLLLFHWSGRTPGPKARRLLNAVLIVLALVQVGRAAYWVRYATSIEHQGLEWSLRLGPPCAPGEKCTPGPGEVTPRNLPWIDRKFNQRALKGASSR